MFAVAMMTGTYLYFTGHIIMSDDLLHESIMLIDATRAKAHAIVSDGDRTLWKSNAAEHGIGIPYIARALRTGSLKTAWNGIQGYLDVKRTMKRYPEDAIVGMATFYSRLRQNRIGKREEMEEMAFEYISTHRIKSTSVVLNSWMPGKRFLASCNGSTVVAAANRVFGFKECTSNKDLFDQRSMIIGIEPKILDGEDKARCVSNMLARHGLKIRNCIYIGDSAMDIPLMEMAGFPVSSPFAQEEVKAAAHFVLSDTSMYRPILRSGHSAQA